jgi:tryptophan halogenase
MTNITIVGGGTAGWLAAFMLSKIYKHKITMIESSKINIIGVGEGGTHILGSLINSKNEFGFSTKDFMIATDATPKMSVQHKGWPNTYSIPLDLLANSDAEDFLPLILSKNQPLHLITEIGLLIENRKVPIRSDETGIWDTSDFSYHFDGHKVGAYLKNNTTATIIDSEVTEVIIDETGNIDKLRLDNGEFNKADLYIDCTGFQKILMTALNAKWTSYSKHLLMNTAMPFRTLWSDIDRSVKNIQPITEAESLNAGWTWSIPLIHSKGMGYVFCEEFCTPAQAVLELNQRYSKTHGEINPTRTIKFEPGRLAKAWNKNCVALGLASAFVEPLEATSIHATKIQIDELGKALKNNHSQDDYNTNIGQLYDEIKDFIVLHYLGGRDDTEFWKYIKNTDITTDRVKELLEISSYRLLTPDDIPNKFNSLSYRAWNQVLAGLGKFEKTIIEKSLTSGVEERYNVWYARILKKALDYKNLDECLERNAEWWL